MGWISKNKSNDKKYRIVKVVNGPYFGNYYFVQYYGGLIKHWKDYRWDKGNGWQREFRCMTFEEAKLKLEECKKCDGDPSGYYEEVVYEE